MNSLQRRRKSRRIVQGVLSVILLLGTMLWAGETRMPQGLWEALTQARYGVRTEKTGAYLAINHRYDYRTRFDQKGIELFPSDPEASWSVKMRLEALDGERLPVAKVERHGTKLSYLRGRVTEWYDNRSKGLEQGFTITTPSTKTPEKVELSLTIETTLKVEQKGDALIFKDSKGDERLRYAKLHAYDATHKALPSRMILEGRTLTLQVETRGVRWPVTVDPLFTTQAKVVADTSQVKDFFGCSVSLDGNRVLIGAYKDDDRGTDSGAVYLFEYDGSAWTQRAKLTAADGADDDYFGISVSLSGDRALVGAYGDDDRGSNSGSAYFFDYDDGVWTQSAKLTADDGAEGDKFGCSVSLLGDRALVGAKGDKNGGSAYIFDFDGSTWRQKIKLTVQGGGSDNFGCSVSLVEDRALIGAYLNNERGAAYIFDYDGSAWTQSAKLTADDGAAYDYFGNSVSLSGDRALIGAVYDDDNGSSSGSAYLFDYDGSTWIQRVKLTASDAVANDRFGTSVSLDGNRALIGADNRGFAYIFEYDGTAWQQSDKLIADDRGAGDMFGCSVSLSGDRALIGSSWDNDRGTFSGSAYIFDYDGSAWSQSAKLVADDGASDDWFGYAVSLSGKRVLIGAYRDDDRGVDSGAAYLFDYNGSDWIQSVKLTASDGAAEDWFGYAVSLSGDRALIGAHYDDDRGTKSGSAYIFDYDGSAWSQRAKLTASDGAAYDYFGKSVSLSGNRALIGAYGDDDQGSKSGSAYIFDYDGSTWNQSAKLTADDGEEDDWFGRSVSLSGNRALIGAYGDNDVQGSAYIFDYDGSTWSQHAKLTADDGENDDRFGWSVSLSGDRALIGAYRDDDLGSRSGSAYLFEYNGTAWSQRVKFTADDGAAGEYFGWSVSLSGDRALIGAYRDDDLGSKSGSAYLFAYDGTAWRQRAKLTADDGAEEDWFGHSVSLFEDRVAVGANNKDGGVGAAYINRFPCALGGRVVANTWQMIGIPCDTGDKTVGELFGDEISGDYLYDWIVYRRDPSTGNYEYLAIDDPLDQNEGYWLKVLDQNLTWYAEGEATTLSHPAGCTSSRGCREVPLHLPADSNESYQNLVGNPVSLSFDWKDVRIAADDGNGVTVYTPAEAENANLVSKTIHRYDGNGYDPCDGTTPGYEECHLYPQTGFWVQSLGGAASMTSVTLLIPMGEVQ